MYLIVSDLETSTGRWPRPDLGCNATENGSRLCWSSDVQFLSSLEWLCTVAHGLHSFIQIKTALRASDATVQLTGSLAYGLDLT